VASRFPLGAAGLRDARNRVEGVEDGRIHEIVLHPHPLEGISIVDDGASDAQVGDGHERLAGERGLDAAVDEWRQRSVEDLKAQRVGWIRAVRPPLLVAAIAM
jgi:hypothetical protein